MSMIPVDMCSLWYIRFIYSYFPCLVKYTTYTRTQLNETMKLLCWKWHCKMKYVECVYINTASESSHISSICSTASYVQTLQRNEASLIICIYWWIFKRQGCLILNTGLDSTSKNKNSLTAFSLSSNSSVNNNPRLYKYELAYIDRDSIS